MDEINQKKKKPFYLKKIIMSGAQWELHVLWNIITTARSLLPCSGDLSVYYITLLLKNWYWLYHCRDEWKHVAWRVHVKKCPWIYNIKSRLRWKGGRGARSPAYHKTRQFGGTARTNHNCPFFSLWKPGHCWATDEDGHECPLRKDLVLSGGTELYMTWQF